jgi:hypothetical protein
MYLSTRGLSVLHITLGVSAIFTNIAIHDSRFEECSLDGKLSEVFIM